MSPKIKTRIHADKETNQSLLNADDSRHLHLLAGLFLVLAVVFTLFFQVNKGGPLREVNPFLDDPYDAVGSFAFQGALLVGLLSYARALRIRHEPVQGHKAGLVLRGDALVLLAVTVTLAGDSAAVFIRGLLLSSWGTILLVELALMWLFDVACILALALATRRIPALPPPADLTPGDAIDDLWTLVRLPARRLRSSLPARLVTWVDRFGSDRLFAHLPWLNPRRYPWRFAAVVGFLVGVAILLVQFQEGLPPSLVFLVLVAGVFLSAEVAATLIGFALFGGYLGLRPPLKKKLNRAEDKRMPGKPGISRKARK